MVVPLKSQINASVAEWVDARKLDSKSEVEYSRCHSLIQ